MRARRLYFIGFFHVSLLVISAWLLGSSYSGDRGLAVSQGYRARIENLSEKLDVLVEDRIAKENRLSNFSRPRVEKDVLEERIRAVLGVVHPDEVIIE